MAKHVQSAQVMARWLEQNPVPGPVLVVDDTGPVQAALEAAGCEVQVWDRERRRTDAHIWAPDGPFATVVLKLPKGRDAQDMVMHAVGSRMAPGANCFIHGRNDEGIKSAGKHSSGVFASFEPLDARKHCRVLRCESPRDGLKGDLADWRTEVEGQMGEEVLRWTSWPGLFAHGRLDVGTQQLLRALPTFKPEKRILDFASGAGVIAARVLAQNPGVTMDVLDIDPLAIHAARINVPKAGAYYLSNAWDQVPRNAKWDVIISNPPLHAGVQPDFTGLNALVDEAGRYLSRQGELYLVTQTNVRLRDRLEKHFARVRVVGSTPGFKTWHAKKGGRS